jgi:hypothetical protein
MFYYFAIVVKRWPVYSEVDESELGWEMRMWSSSLGAIRETKLSTECLESKTAPEAPF